MTKHERAQALHRAFSLAQSMFDDDVRQRVDGRRDFLTGSEAVENRLHGATVFAGADDVSAFVPLDQCLAAAWMMQALFRQKLREKLNAVDPTVAAAMEKDGTFPTLSVGIAIGHFLDPLEDLLRFAKQAEHRAKEPTAADVGQSDRNGLAIAIHSRGGAPFTVRVNWSDQKQSDQAFQNLIAWVQLSLTGELSEKAAYDLRELARSFALNTWGSRDDLASAISGDAVRVLGRKRGEDGDARTQLRERLQSVRTPGDLEAVANQLLVGQWIAKSQRQSGFRWSPPPDKSPTQAVGTESQPTEEARP